MAVYGLNEITISEDVQERIDIGVLYYSIMNEDCNLFGEEYIVTEAFDFKKIKNTITEKISNAVNKCIELLGELWRRISKIFDRFKEKKYEKTERIYQKVKKKLQKVKKITIPESANIIPPAKNPQKRAMDEADKITNTANDIFLDYYNKMNHLDIENTDFDDLKAEMKNISESDGAKIADLARNFDTDKIFFTQDSPTEFTLSGRDMVELLDNYDITGKIQNDVKKLFSKLQHNMEGSIDLNEGYLKTVMNMNHKDETFAKNILSIYGSSCYRVIVAYTQETSTIAKSITNSSTKYISTIWKMLSFAVRKSTYNNLSDLGSDTVTFLDDDIEFDDEFFED